MVGGESKQTKEYNKSHKITMIKLVWPFTLNAGRENGKKKYKSGNRYQYDHGRPKNKWEDDKIT